MTGSSLSRIGVATLAMMTALVGASGSTLVVAQTATETAQAAPAVPMLEFVFEEYVTLDKAVTVGDTAPGH